VRKFTQGGCPGTDSPVFRTHQHLTTSSITNAAFFTHATKKCHHSNTKALTPRVPYSKTKQMQLLAEQKPTQCAAGAEHMHPRAAAGTAATTPHTRRLTPHKQCNTALLCWCAQPSPPRTPACFCGGVYVMMHLIPAPRAASSPMVLSSTTTQSAGARPSF